MKKLTPLLFIFGLFTFLYISPIKISAQACGSVGLDCCTPPRSLLPPFVCGAIAPELTNVQCITGKCTLCGGMNLPCCPQGGICGVPGNGLVCTGGTCVPRNTDVCGTWLEDASYCSYTTGPEPIAGASQCPGNARKCCNPVTLCEPIASLNCSTKVGGACQAGFGTDCSPIAKKFPDYCCKTADQCATASKNAGSGPSKIMPKVDPTCDGGNGVSTALGCLDIRGISTIEVLLNWSTGLGGGIAFIVIVIAAFQITTASGDAKKVKAGQELLISALSGLFLIALSVVILNFVGVNVLGLQKFGFAP